MCNIYIYKVFACYEDLETKVKRKLNNSLIIIIHIICYNYTSARVNMVASTRMVKTVKHNFTTWSAYDSVVWVEVWGEGEERRGRGRRGRGEG